MLRLFVIVIFMFGINSCRIFHISGSNTIITEGQYTILSLKENGLLKDSCLITGYIFDRRINYPVEHVFIRLNEQKMLSETDSMGYFSIKCNPGIYILKVISAGYFTLETSPIDLKPNTVLEMKIDLGSEVQFETNR
ncbi:MAG: hypothetical protein IPG01_03300 [Chitinophagaceae bacterium]|nr:hypothetical protein [Chitinophagaceae bacterium]